MIAYTGQIFAIFSPYESAFGADDPSGSLFTDLSLSWQPINATKK